MPLSLVASQLYALGMGLFSKQSADEKARAFATKKGVPVVGATAVGRAFQGGADQVMVVHPDRVEVHHLGRVASIGGQGAGVMSLPRDRAGSVSTRREGVWCVVRVEGSGQDVEFKTDVDTGERLAAALRS